MAFCYAPWTGIEILPAGRILPCCKWDDTTYEEKFNIVDHDIDDYRNSKKLIEIKQQMLAGEWPRGCQRCKIEEEAGIQSRRQLDAERWKHHYKNYNLDSDQLLTVGMAIGNVCNIKCITCSPHASSRWQKEHKDIHGKTVPIIEKFRKDFINSITKRAPHLVHVDIHGGEPFLSGKQEHHRLLDYYINSKQAKNITIHYNTNGTIWPKEFLEKWKHFAEIDLQLSIDGVAERFEYIRFPANWAVLNKNIKQYQKYMSENSNFRMSVAHTVSAFNIYYLDEFVTWCNLVELPKPWLGRLHNPAYLRASVWHQAARQCIIDKLASSEWQQVQDWAVLMSQTDDSHLFDEFKKFVTQHDQYRKLDYKNTFSELGKFF